MEAYRLRQKYGLIRVESHTSLKAVELRLNTFRIHRTDSHYWKEVCECCGDNVL